MKLFYGNINLKMVYKIPIIYIDQLTEEHGTVEKIKRVYEII